MRYVSLKRRSDFKAATHSEIRFIGKFSIIQLGQKHPSAQQSELSEIGFTVSKKVGNAYQRNLIKRRLKSICRELPSYPELNQGKYIVIVARKQINKAQFSELTQEIANGLNWIIRKCKCKK